MDSHWVSMWPQSNPFQEIPTARRRDIASKALGQRSGDLGTLCAVPARPRLGASSSIHIPAIRQLWNERPQTVIQIPFQMLLSLTQ